MSEAVQSAFGFAPGAVAVVFATFLLAGFVKGVVGVGLPTVAVGLLTATIGLQPAMSLIVVPATATNIWQALYGGQLVPLLRRLWSYLALAGVCTWVGVVLLVWSDHPLLPLILAATLLIYGALSLMRLEVTIPPQREGVLSPALGSLNGLLMGLTGSGTMPGVFYFNAIGLDRNALVQAMGLLFLTVTVALGLSLGERGALDMRVATLSLASLVPTFAGVFVGQSLRHRLSERAFRTALYWALILLGVAIIFRTL